MELHNVVVAAGTLHVGDEIKEINGSPVQNQPVETLQRILVSVTHAEIRCHVISVFKALHLNE